MTRTMDSAASSYLPVAEFLKRCDVRTVASLVADTGARVGSSTDISAMAAALATDANLIAALADASGELEGACLRASIYTQADLAQIAASGTVAQARMYRILARLTMCLLWERRVDKGAPPESYKTALEDLKALAGGERLFGTIEGEKAGVMSDHVLQRGDPAHDRGIARRARGYFGAGGHDCYRGGPVP